MRAPRPSLVLPFNVVSMAPPDNIDTSFEHKLANVTGDLKLMLPEMGKSDGAIRRHVEGSKTSGDIPRPRSENPLLA